MRQSTLSGVLLAWAGCAIEGGVLYGERRTDTFAQAPTDAVDVLWVVDDSCSMADEQARLADGFAAFAEPLEAAGTDFQLGLITTSFDAADDERGVLIGEPALLTPADDWRALFPQRLKLGTYGSDKEKGLEAALYALGPAADPGGPNEGLLRPEAALVVVFVSDEEDCSDGGALDGDPPTACYTSIDELTPVGVWLDDLLDLEQDRSRVQVGAIVGHLPSTCDDAVPGARYLEAAALTGGRAGDICGVDWTPTLAELGVGATGIRSAFQLSHPAQPETLEVEVEGQRVEPGDVDGWTYDPATWFVVFHGHAVPPRGAEIVVRYVEDPGRLSPEVPPSYAEAP